MFIFPLLQSFGWASQFLIFCRSMHTQTLLCLRRNRTSFKSIIMSFLCEKKWRRGNMFKSKFLLTCLLFFWPCFAAVVHGVAFANFTLYIFSILVGFRFRLSTHLVRWAIACAHSSFFLSFSCAVEFIRWISPLLIFSFGYISFVLGLWLTLQTFSRFACMHFERI